MIMDKKQFADFCADLESGRIRVAEKIDGNWKVNAWIKEAIREGFKLGTLTDITEGQFPFIDKDTIPVRKLTV